MPQEHLSGPPASGGVGGSAACCQRAAAAPQLRPRWSPPCVPITALSAASSASARCSRGLIWRQSFGSVAIRSSTGGHVTGGPGGGLGRRSFLAPSGGHALGRPLTAVRCGGHAPVALPGGFDLYIEALIPGLQYEAAGERAVGEFGTESSADQAPRKSKTRGPRSGAL
jgi:hypothetical protein